MSNDAVQKITQSIPMIKILPPQVVRLKEEEKETWISDEDLYTEGSSDEENCCCEQKQASEEALKESSSSTLDKPLRPKPKSNKKSKTSRSTSDKDSLAVQSTSRESRDSSMSSIASDDDEKEEEEEDNIADDEISWKVNRELVIEDDALQEYQQEYPKICDSMQSIFQDYFSVLNITKNTNKEHFKNQKEKLQNEITNSVQFFDAVIDKLHNEIECIKQRTRQVQLRNRLRLREILQQASPESKKLARNTKSFFELCDENELKSLPDVVSCTTFESSENSDSTKYSQVKRKLMELLDATDPSGESFLDLNSAK